MFACPDLLPVSAQTEFWLIFRLIRLHRACRRLKWNSRLTLRGDSMPWSWTRRTMRKLLGDRTPPLNQRAARRRCALLALEALEERAVPSVMKPTYLVHHPNGNPLLPASSSAPTGVTPATMRQA